MRSFTLIIALIITSNTYAQLRMVLPIGHTGKVSECEFSPDGRFILTAAADGGLKLWDAITGKLVRDYVIHKEKINSVRFAEDSKTFITASDDGAAKVVETQTGNVLKEFKEQEQQVVSAQVSPNGKHVLTAADRYLFIWDLQTGKMLDKIGAHSGSIVDAFYSRDGKKIFSSSWDYTARIWDAADGVLLHDLKGHRHWLTSISLSHHQKYLVTAAKDSTAIIWDVESGQLIHELRGHKQEVLTGKFSANDEQLITVSKDRTAIVWDVASGRQIRSLTGHTSDVIDVSFSPDNQQVITAAGDGTVKIWKLDDGELLSTARPHFAMINKIRFSPDGKSFTTASSDGTAVVWDAASGNSRLHLRGYSSGNQRGSFSKDGRSILTVSDYGLNVWNARTGMRRFFIRQPEDYIHYAEILPKGDRVITTSRTHLYLWDVSTGTLVSKRKIRAGAIQYSFSPDGMLFSASFGNGVELYWMDDEKKTVPIYFADQFNRPIPTTSARFSPDGKLVGMACGDGTARIIDPLASKIVHILSGHQRMITDVAFTPDSKGVFTFSMDGSGKLWDLSTGRPGVTIMHFSTDPILGKPILIFSPDATRLAVVQYRSVNVFDMQTGNRVSEMNGHTAEITHAAFSSDGKKMITTSKDNTAKVWDVATGTRTQNLKGHDGSVNYAGFSMQGDKIVTTSDDNTTKVWSQKGELLYTFFAAGDGYLVQLPSKHYLATPGTARMLHYVTEDMKTVSFDQLDVKFNRPDIVLSSISNEDTALIRSYKKAYEKRIKKLGIDTSAANSNVIPPQISITNESFTGYETTQRTIKLRIRATDTISRLLRMNVWINDIPVLGTNGIALGRKKSHSIDTTIQLQLSQGPNHIQASVINANGTESYRMPLYLKLESSVPAKTYFVGIGIDRFAENGHDLNWSVKDIRDLAAALKEKYNHGIIIDTLFNEQVTAANVSALKSKLKKTTTDDMVIISYSGHGLLSKNFDYYLSTFNVNFSRPELNGLPYEALEDLLDGIPSRKKLMLIDACHSGEVDKEEMERYTLVEKTLEDSGTKSGRKPVQTDGKLGMKNSFELMQELFVNVSRGTGATVISAAAGTQFAQEKGSLQNGVFTYSILEYMKKNPSATVSQLKEYVNKRVSELTNGLQVPTARSETRAVDWRVW